MTMSEWLSSLGIEVVALNVAYAIIIFVVGIVLGKVIKRVLKMLTDRLKFSEKIRGSFVDLFLTIIKWCIYILFFSMALSQLKLPALTDWLTSVLLIIPSLVFALILIAIGFGIAVYLRDVIEDSEVLGWKVFSMIMFYFVLYVFLVYALDSALVSLAQETVNWIILSLTIIAGVTLAYWHVKKKE